MFLYNFSSTKTAGKHGKIFIYFFMCLLKSIFCKYEGMKTDFCFDGTKEGHRLQYPHLKHLSALSGPECILKCMLEDECCQSVNYRKSCVGKKNCELLRSLASEKPELLKEDANFDHYVLLQPKRDPTTFNCPDSPCLNGGKCVGGCGNATSFCNCSIRYSGKHCEINDHDYPSTCKHLQEGYNKTDDGEYNLYLKWPNCTQSSKIYCADMNTTNPKEYVTLPTGGNYNYALHYNKTEGYREQSYRTSFEKVRLNVDDFSVDIKDFRFASTTIPDIFNRFATAGDCLSHFCSEEYRKGNFTVNLSGTNFLLPNSIPYWFGSFPECTGQVFKRFMSSDNRQWSGFCGGHCGYCEPIKMYLIPEGC